ncbi:MAG: hypothetical protein U5R46_12475 [Gammaproteobacteria bacterium]|nr:hypothetical protein [Gammaproteobacteria bacterium]
MKKYGIRITLTEDNPMRAAHLLGEDWEAYRWYDDPGTRDEALENMRTRLPNYRLGDVPSQIVEPVER